MNQLSPKKRDDESKDVKGLNGALVANARHPLDDHSRQGTKVMFEREACKDLVTVHHSHKSFKSIQVQCLFQTLSF